MAQVMIPDEIAAFAGLLDALAAQGFDDADVDGAHRDHPRLRRPGPGGQARAARTARR